VTYHGVMAVFKPKGYTSHDIVAKMRRLTGQKKVGHTGTLDPEVEGVLPICFGQATRIVEYMQMFPKRYRGSVQIGISTDTQDQTGKILAKKPVPYLDQVTIAGAMKQLTGEIEQIPPMYSAVKVQGKKCYEWARQGKEIPRSVRKVTIYAFICTGYTTAEYPLVTFDVQCSKGTYIRTLCVALGEQLGYPAHMTSLIRTETGPFRLEDCFTLEALQEIAQQASWSQVLSPLDQVLVSFPSLIVPAEEARRVLDGRPLQLETNTLSTPSLVKIYAETGTFCALYQVDESGWAKPEKVFRDVES
jgi:tRNA pseudouridine55 synthase